MMKNTLPSRFTPALAAVTLSLLAFSTSAHAATLSYSLSAPSVGVNDQSNLTGATSDANNVPNGSTNGGSTYLAHDQGSIGQTFTTGSNVGGYTLTALSLQATPTGYGSGFSDTSQASTLTVRLGTISGGTTFSVSSTETVAVTGGEANRPSFNGSFLTVTLSTPLTLAANTTYFFDMAVTAGTYYFQTNGTSVVGSYTGGDAYHTLALGGAHPASNDSGGSLTLIQDSGDHVFVASMTANAIPEPSTYGIAAGGLALVGAMVARRRRANAARA